MRLPFTVEQFLDVFARLNQALWPGQLGAVALGLLTVGLAVRGGPAAGRAVPFLLAGAWAFVGAVYHLAFFSPVSPAAGAFGALFLVQAGLLTWSGQARTLSFGWAGGPRAVAGVALVAYALVAYPILGALLGRSYPRVPLFGVAPCPTTVFTFGVLLLSCGPVPVRLLAVPVAWSAVGLSAALQLGMHEDLGLAAAAAVALALLRPRMARPGLGGGGAGGSGRSPAHPTTPGTAGAGSPR